MTGVGDEAGRGCERVVQPRHAAGGRADDGPGKVERRGRSAAGVGIAQRGEAQRHHAAGGHCRGSGGDGGGERSAAVGHHDIGGGAGAGISSGVHDGEVQRIGAGAVGSEAGRCRARVVQLRRGARGRAGHRPAVRDRSEGAAADGGVVVVGDLRLHLHGSAGPRPCGSNDEDAERRIAAGHREGLRSRSGGEPQRVGEVEPHGIGAVHVGSEAGLRLRAVAELRGGTGGRARQRPAVVERQEGLAGVGVGDQRRELQRRAGRSRGRDDLLDDRLHAAAGVGLHRHQRRRARVAIGGGGHHRERVRPGKVGDEAWILEMRIVELRCRAPRRRHRLPEISEGHGQPAGVHVGVGHRHVELGDIAAFQAAGTGRRGHRHRAAAAAGREGEGPLAGAAVLIAGGEQDHIVARDVGHERWRLRQRIAELRGRAPGHRDERPRIADGSLQGARRLRIGVADLRAQLHRPAQARRLWSGAQRIHLRKVVAAACHREEDVLRAAGEAQRIGGAQREIVVAAHVGDEGGVEPRGADGLRAAQKGRGLHAPAHGDDGVGHVAAGYRDGAGQRHRLAHPCRRARCCGDDLRRAVRAGLHGVRDRRALVSEVADDEAHQVGAREVGYEAGRGAFAVRQDGGAAGGLLRERPVEEERHRRLALGDGGRSAPAAVELDADADVSGGRRREGSRGRSERARAARPTGERDGRRATRPTTSGSHRFPA